ncbi:MAG: family 78 glycoside hydrolase catalytic domain [Sphingomonas phyllosphaerae]|uniref:family 78 glycoside hydrolase catalytic domain n=1 Tax=Sphingomonas phyllosphaerae TaxID=257003 RepID=UPI002FFA6DC7
MLNRRELLAAAGGTAAVPLASAARAAADVGAPDGLLVDLRRQPAGIMPEAARLSWIAPAGARGAQTAWQVQAATSRRWLLAGRPDRDTGRRTGDAATGVALPDPIVTPGQHIFWRVRSWDEAGRVSQWSAPQRLIGAAPANWAARPIWATAPTDWLLARLAFDAPRDIAAAWLHITAASPEPARQYVFRLTLNGDFVGVGPVRSHDPAAELRYATFDLTDRLRAGANVLAALCHTTEGHALLAQLTIVRADGERIVIGTGPDSDWRVAPGDRWRPASGTTGGGYYAAPQEFIDARAEPVGWDRPGFDARGWSTPAAATLGMTLQPERVDPVVETLVTPAMTRLGPGRWLFDMGREIVGGVRLSITGTAGQTVELRLGEERGADGGARHKLRASQEYREVWTLRDGAQSLQHWGYRAFRWVEVLADPALDLTGAVTGRRLALPWHDDESAFTSASADLDRVWTMCRYSIEALRLDLYQDTPTRERGPYEGDAIVNQLSEFATQRSYAVSRYSTGYLARRPTWPTEYRMQTPVLAWRDYMATGDPGVLSENYAAMVARFLPERLNAEGLVEKDPGASSRPEGDLVDWPVANRDGYVFTRVNTVVNCWQYAALVALADIAGVLGRAGEAARFAALAHRLRDAINARLLAEDGSYADGIGTDHRSQHATAFAVALGIVPDSHRRAAGRVLAGQGMRMSVYGAQFLLEALFRSEQPRAALALMTSRARFSWLHMIDDLGATVAMEAWDPAIKPNTTFSHAWGSAPANIVPRFMAGLEVTAPGAAALHIRPEPAGLARFAARIPTIRGPVAVDYRGDSVSVRAPANVDVTVELSRALLAGVDPARVPIVGAGGRRVLADGGVSVRLGSEKAMTARLRPATRRSR